MGSMNRAKDALLKVLGWTMGLMFGILALAMAVAGGFSAVGFAVLALLTLPPSRRKIVEFTGLPLAGQGLAMGLGVTLFVTLGLAGFDGVRFDAREEESAPESVSDSEMAETRQSEKAQGAQTPDLSRRTPKRNEQGAVVSDTFDVRASFEGNEILVALRTDLPDFAPVMFSVDRAYREVGDDETYVMDYHSERSTVGAWRTPRQFRVDNQEWREKVEDHRRTMAELGEPYQVSSVSPEVSVEMVVPITFGRDHGGLAGEVVEDSGLGFGRVVRDEVLFQYPLGAEIDDTDWVSALDLMPDRTYSVSKRTPLVVDPDPADPLGAIDAIRHLEAGSRFQVLDRVPKSSSGGLWYQVQVRLDGEPVIRWINSAALLGQEIVER